MMRGLIYYFIESNFCLLLKSMMRVVIIKCNFFLNEVMMLGGRRILRVMSSGKLGDGRAPRTHLKARARAWTQARTYKDAGESDGARMWMEKAARAGTSGGSAHRGLAERAAATAFSQCN